MTAFLADKSLLAVTLVVVMAVVAATSTAWAAPDAKVQSVRIDAPVQAAFKPVADTPPLALSIDRFTVAGHGSVNTWILQSSTGVVVVDFQRDVESAQAALRRVQTTGKPVLALLLTHAHPDHIGGIELFKQAFSNAPLYASRRTAAELRSDSRGYQKLTQQLFADKAPSSYPGADRILQDIDRIEVGGMRIETRELGPSESESATMYYLPEQSALFTGDVVANRVTDFLLEERTGAWLAQLRTLKLIYPLARNAYPGHGAMGQLSALVQHSTRYLEDFRMIVSQQLSRAADPRAELSDEAIGSIAAEVERRYPDQPRVAPIPGLLGLNAAAVARELQREARQSAPSR